MAWNIHEELIRPLTVIGNIHEELIKPLTVICNIHEELISDLKQRENWRYEEVIDKSLCTEPQRWMPQDYHHCPNSGALAK